MRRLFTIVMLFLSSHAFAQTKIPVLVVANTENDMLGGNLVYEVKEEIRASHSMRLLDVAPEGGSYIEMHIGTRPLTANTGQSLGSIYCAIFIDVWPNEDSLNSVTKSYLNSILGNFPEDAVNSAAESIVAQADRVLSPYRPLFK